MDINALWESAISGNPIAAAEQWTEEQVFEMAKQLDLYSENQLDKTKLAAISYTNITEVYARRYLMTGLIGFLFQVLHEWEVPLKTRQIVLDPAPVKNNLTLNTIINTLEPVLELAKSAREKEQKSVALKMESNEASLLGDNAKNVDNMNRDAAALDDDVAKAMFVITRKLADVGKEAAYNYKTVYDNCKKYPGAAAELAELRKSAPVDEYLPSDINTIELPKAAAKGIIEEFVQNYFEFDPSEHVRSAKNKFTINDFGMQADDPVAPTVDLLKSRPVIRPEHEDICYQIESSPRFKAALVTILQEMQCENTIFVMQNANIFRTYLYPVQDNPALQHVPPADTFHRYEYYMDVNYEKIRNITEALYPERACFETQIAIWDTFHGKTEKECADAFDMHCQKNKNQFRHPVISVNFGQWTALGSFKGNREKINYYSNATDILKKIEDRAASDKKLGTELLQKRVEKAKAANIATDGPDDVGLGDYRNNIVTTKSTVQSLGAKKFIDPVTMRKLESSAGDQTAAADIKVLADIDAEIEKYLNRELTPFETFKLNELKAQRNRTVDTMDVPDNAEQIDIFSTDAKGEFSRRKIYVDRTMTTEPTS
jgi:hypothetical protein